MMYSKMPRPRKITPNTVKVIIVERKEGIGRQAGRVCCLKREFLSFSTFSRMRAFSYSDVLSIVVFILIFYNLLN